MVAPEEGARSSTSEVTDDLLERTRFEPSEVEPQIIERWLQSGLFHPPPEGDAASNYSIAIPPPNVTDRLHMGHALNNTIQDVLVRYHRMLGLRTKWILGTDHAGIATQTQVEKMLRAEGTSREEVGREEFVRRVWAWREHYGGTIVEQLKRLGASCDYEEERFTLDEGYARSVAEAFVTLYRRGYIYRDRYIVNWDPGSNSAISDLEVENRRETDTLYSIVYDLEGGGTMTIATVRPETMLADTAVAVNPGDERYKELVGQTAVLPLVGRRLPIIADDYVKTDFGTGQLKVTPAHDPNDFDIGARHGLEVISVIGEDGRMTPQAGERFAGMPVDEARAAVVAALQGEGRIAAAEAIRARSALLASLGRPHRAARLAAVVHGDGEARRAGDTRGSGGARPHHPREPRARLWGVDGGDPAVVHLAPALVGPPPSRLLLRTLP